MSQNIFIQRSRLLILAAAAVAVWLILPFALQIGSSPTQAQTATTPALIAPLTGAPIGGITPAGTAAYITSSAAGTTGRVFRVEVSNVNFAVGKQLSVFFKTNNIGNITLDAAHHGILNLSTANGDTVPTPIAGDPVSVKDASTVVLSGNFMVPLPPPSPTATPTPPPTPVLQLFAPLAAPTAAATIVPRGLAEYTEFTATARGFDIWLSNINLPDGTVLNVGAGGNPIGQLTIHAHAGALHLRTALGDTVPVLAAGNPVTVRNAGAVVLAGVFTSNPPPPPPPPARAFDAKLNGRHEVPPVASDGHGFGTVVLDPAGNAINVRVAYTHLGAPATTITINGPAGPDTNGPVIFTIANPGGTEGHTAPQSFNVTAQQLAQLRNGVWYFQIATAAVPAVGYPNGEIRGQIRPVNRRGDFDGDGVSDISVVRPHAGFAPDNAGNDWYVLNSSDNTVTLQSIGQAGDVAVQGDYDGDGIADIAMFTPSTGTWQIRRSGTGETSYIRFGTIGDIPMVGDYDGDGINDVAVYRPADGNWYVLRSSDGQFSVTHWGAAGDRPVSGDFDGDGISDLAIFRPATGDWYINRSTDGGLTAMHWGLNGDQPVAGDFDGDGTNDIAVFRPTEGNWYIYRSSDSQFSAYHFGSPGDIPVACEYDGDGVTDIAVFRPSNGNWYINSSLTNTMGVYHFGISTDHPIQMAYAP